MTGPRNRWITKVRLTFDGDLVPGRRRSATSRAPLPGQVVDIRSGGTPRTFDTVEFEITGDTYGKLPGYKGLTSVGLAELGIPGVTATEVVRVPTRLLAEAGAGLAEHRVTVVMTRLRSDPTNRGRSDEEVRLERALNLPAGGNVSR